MSFMNKFFIYAVLSIVLFGCGGGSSSDSGGSMDGFNFNEQGFPIVSGRYSVAQSDLEYECNNGERGRSPAPSLISEVDQEVNSIIIRSDRPEIGNVQILSDSGTNGFVNRDASFSTTLFLTAKIDNVPGNVEYVINRSGRFTPSSWSGSTETTATIMSVGVVCTYKGSFSGEKIISRDMSSEKKPSSYVEKMNSLIMNIL